jgi:hypothetical protein
VWLCCNACNLPRGATLGCQARAPSRTERRRHAVKPRRVPGALPSRRGSGIPRRANGSASRVRHFPHARRRGREAEGGGLLNRYRVVTPYRGFESLRLRQPRMKPGLAPRRRRFERNAMSAAKRRVTPRRGVLQALTHVLACLVLAWLALAAAQLALRPAFALDAAEKPNPSFTAPLPPARPTGPAGARATIDSPQAPAISAAPIEAPMPQRDPPPQPRNLPPASRARMHECGLEWQKMKETGAAADKTWLDFARICLAK